MCDKNKWIVYHQRLYYAFIETNELNLVGKPLDNDNYVVIKKKFNKLPDNVIKIGKSLYLVKKKYIQKIF